MHDELREPVECRDLDRALPGQRFFDLAKLLLGHDPAIRPDDALAVCRGGLVRIEIHHREAVHLVDELLGRADHGAEHVAEVRGRVGAHQQHAVTGVRERHRGGAGHRRLADATLAGEEQEEGLPAGPVQRCVHSGRTTMTSPLTSHAAARVL
ncbi:hypothetical protein LRS13_13095 [Svornostia abyssi]|uniref:Uncharacterized protein n=1 Tax=Svornostia abyssi TaxID=2898438 RepID=A0ABY5PAE0_9ACTN|nr:hypothetical protein LRS13_13095 [Parviterribacteraceae bacterium J379]